LTKETNKPIPKVEPSELDFGGKRSKAMSMNPEALKDYCDLSARCLVHPNGEGCISKHYPEAVQTCADYCRLKQLIEGQPAEEEPKS